MALLEVFAPDGRKLVNLEAPPPEEGAFSDFIVGRSPEVWLRLTDPKGGVSRLHAKFSPVADRWAIEDLGSRNGTWVNGARLTGVRILRNGDEIRFATIAALFRDPTLADEDTTKPKAVPPSITPRERDVLVELCRPFFSANLLKRAASRREIADALFTGEAAVQQHLSHLYDKFFIAEAGENRRDLLAVTVIEAGIIVPGDYEDRT
jgi:pSer/pThr/pTyr-binding forkhead associated (FHA) protein